MLNNSRQDRIIAVISKWFTWVRLKLTDPVRRFQLSLVFLLMFVLMGVIGFMIIERLSVVDALYLTVVTVTTVGFGDIVPTSDASRVFTVLLIVFGLGTATTALSNAIEILAGQRLWAAVREHRIEEVLRLIENHYVVAGYGRIGQQIVKDILARGEQCVVVDMDLTEEETQHLTQEGVAYLVGDATDDDILIAAGIERARGFVAALPSDADNVLVSLTARGLKPDLYIVARASRLSAERKLRRAGANQVISPYQVGGHRMAMALLRPAVHDFLNQLSDTSDRESHDIGEVDVSETSDLIGQTVATCDLRRVKQLSILAVVNIDNKLIINPAPTYEFMIGDRLIVIGPPRSIYRLEEIHEE